MKKILLVFVLLFLSGLLYACDPYNVDGFNENDIVEMSNEDLATLLSTVDWEPSGEAMEVLVNADIDIQTQTSISLFYAIAYDLEVSLAALIESKSYIQYSDVISEVALHSESSVAFDYSYTKTMNNDVQEGAYAGEGDVNAYFYDGFLYVNPKLDVTSEDLEMSINGKEKLEEEVTQEMWDDLVGEQSSDELPNEFLDLFNQGDINELINVLDLDHIDEILSVFPVVTVYQKGTVTNIHFGFNKALILDYLEDVVTYAYETMVEEGTMTLSQEELEAEITSTISAVNEYLDYFETLNMTMDVILDAGNLARYVVSLDVQTTEDSLEALDVAMDITLSIEVNLNANLPDAPNDLDDYTPVPEIGDSYDFLEFGTE